MKRGADPAFTPSSPRAADRRAPSRARFWRWARRATQALFLLFFAFLLWGAQGEPAPVGWKFKGLNPDVVFLADPLTWLAAFLASRSLPEKTVLILGIFFVLTVLFGRVFCGWVCPLGTLIDGAGRLLRPARLERRATRERLKSREASPLEPFLGRRTKYLILIALLVLALFGVNAAGWFDPLAILMRATAFSLVPAGEWSLEQTLGRAAYAPGVSEFLYPAYQWSKDEILASTPHQFGQGPLHLLILLGVLALSRIRRRYWCSVLCPLGAFWAVVARFSVWKRRVQQTACNQCSICATTCRMEAVPLESADTVDPGECLRCMECAEMCPRAGIEFTARPSAESVAAESRPLDLTRRGVLGALAAGALAAPALRLSSSRNLLAVTADSLPTRLDAHLLRPPGARAEPEFLELCVRCGECLKVCPQNALHPALLQAGLEGLWTPLVVPRIGYCEPSCTLCSQVCPTGAIQPLTAPERAERVTLGVAVFDRSRCLPWAQGESCSVCEEMCPVSPKAIRLGWIITHDWRGQEVEVLAPTVRPGWCIGCGICENKCPLEGESAVRVIRQRESRHASSFESYHGAGGGYGQGAGGGQGQGRRRGQQSRGAAPQD